MSFIDKSEVVEAYTDATLDDLRRALESFGYTVSQSRISLTATYREFGGHNSNILVLDQNGIRYCKDTETSVGYITTPDIGRLHRIIAAAEGRR